MTSQEEKCNAINKFYKSIIPTWKQNIDSCASCKILAKNVMAIDAKLTRTSVEESKKASVTMIAVIDHFKKEHGKT